MLDRTTRIAVAGAGSIGCYAGGCLALAGRSVTLLARPRIVDAVATNGLADRRSRRQRAQTWPVRRSRRLTDPAAAFAGAGLVLVTVKSGDTADMAELIARHAPPDATVVSLQNGTGNAARSAAIAGRSQRVVAGMVPFNVVQERDAGRARSFFGARPSGEVHGRSGRAGPGRIC